MSDPTPAEDEILGRWGVRDDETLIVDPLDDPREEPPRIERYVIAGFVGVALVIAIAVGFGSREVSARPDSTASVEQPGRVEASPPVKPVADAKPVAAPVEAKPFEAKPVVAEPVVEAPVVEAKHVEAPVVEAKQVEAKRVEAKQVAVAEPPVVEAPTKKVAAAEVERTYRTGVRRFATGDTSGAKTMLEGALATNPNHAPSWRALGFVYEKRGDRTRARAAYQRYLRLLPRAGDAASIRGRVERLKA